MENTIRMYVVHPQCELWRAQLQVEAYHFQPPVLPGDSRARNFTLVQAVNPEATLGAKTKPPPA